MNFIKRLFHFLGGIYFAIFLIATVAFLVITGTFIESKTESHLHAAHWTYSNPFFKTLLWLFFINIGVAALRRWPFKKRHIPFLLTHLGLLMILGGTLIKSYFGTQGHLVILEGSSSRNLLLPDSYALLLEKKGEEATLTPLDSLQNSPVEIEVLNYHPHSSEILSYWMKEREVKLLGLPAFPIVNTNNLQEAFKFPLHLSSTSEPWSFYAFQVEEPLHVIKQLYIQNAQLHIDKETLPLAQAIQAPVYLTQGTLRANFINEESSLFLDLEWKDPSWNSPQHFCIPLTGPQALFLKEKSFNHNLEIRIEQPPALLFIRDQSQQEFFALLTPHGEVYLEALHPPSSFFVLDKGFKGYAVKITFPLSLFSSLEEKRESLLHHFLLKMHHEITESQSLPAPFKPLWKVCNEQGVDFVRILTLFLKQWELEKNWLFPQDTPLSVELRDIFEKFSVNQFSSKELHSAVWISQFFEHLEGQHVANPLTFLKQTGWPLFNALEQAIPEGLLKNQLTQKETLTLFSLLTEQLSSLGELLPQENYWDMQSATDKARLFSTLLRHQGFHYDLERPFTSQEEREELTRNYRLASGQDLREQFTELFFPITYKISPQEPLAKWEENAPMLILKIKKEENTDYATLRYDRSAKGFKWPILKGEYLIRFQPLVKKIPYEIRLRDARQISYSNSSQPYSFESDLIVTEKRDQFNWLEKIQRKFKPENLTAPVIEKSISMNQIHETWDGFRFYMSNLTPSTDTAAQLAQIAVNYDPGKYLLTYPGALILALGILLLFWLQPYKT